MYDLDSLKKQAVVDFSTRRSLRTEQSKKSQDQIEMKEKIAEAKVHAQDELIAFREIINTAMEQCSELALFKDASQVLESIFIKTLLEEITEPIIKGTPMPHVDPTVYKETRKGMFRELIKKYSK